MKVVINSRFGGFGLSEEAVRRYHSLKGNSVEVREGNALTGVEYWVIQGSDAVDSDGFAEWFCDRDIDRADPVLVQVVQELGDRANGRHAQLKIVDVPEGVEWELHEIEGDEWIAEVHRIWR
jgi:hypothetical protein